jgi:TPR repeat protein
MYDYGEGTEEDNPTALKWYTQAAQKGQLYAQYYLGFYTSMVMMALVLILKRAWNG